jgi:hypothetical protein
LLFFEKDIEKKDIQGFIATLFKYGIFSFYNNIRCRHRTEIFVSLEEIHLNFAVFYFPNLNISKFTGINLNG